MCKKIIYIAILLLNSVIVFSQEKNDTKTKSSDKNTPVTDTGGGGCQYLVYLDNDLDGYGAGTGVCYDLILDESLPYVSINGDCDDNESSITVAKYWYLDADGDGFGGTQTSTKLCYPPNGLYISIGGDCVDSSNTINPNTIWYQDADNDTFGNPTPNVNNPKV